ncbi:hypothetical protein PG993_011444 [Apiospora rasikravindrae]|uniref:Uncharacterized protein n=1 Tax=Apiospora rasikravindrae TaxID=990691 RepID=A0ABR1SEE6_9PEZI
MASTKESIMDDPISRSNTPMESTLQKDTPPEDTSPESTSPDHTPPGSASPEGAPHSNADPRADLVLLQPVITCQSPQLNTERSRIVTLNHTDVKNWPESRATKFCNNSLLAQSVYAILDEDVEKWGPGILYYTFSTSDLTWDKALISRLPQVPPSREPDQPRHQLMLRHLLNRATKDAGTKHWAPMDLNIVTDGQNRTVYAGGVTSQWHHKYPDLIDDWECAFRPINRNGQARPLDSTMNEEVCIWLIEHNLGFSTRPGGIPIQHLAEAAVMKKTRLVEALLKYFRTHLSVKKYQRAITLAVHAAGRGWAGPREPKRPMYLQEQLTAAAMITDGHEAVIEMLLDASENPAAQLQQNPGRRDDEGLLARAVRSAPNNALYLAKKQMALGVVDQRARHAAISAAINPDDSEEVRKKHFEFIQIIL